MCRFSSALSKLCLNGPEEGANMVKLNLSFAGPPGCQMKNLSLQLGYKSHFTNRFKSPFRIGAPSEMQMLWQSWAR